MKFVSLKKKIQSVTLVQTGQGYLHSTLWPVPKAQAHFAYIS